MKTGFQAKLVLNYSDYLIFTIITSVNIIFVAVIVIVWGMQKLRKLAHAIYSFFFFRSKN